jgi:hypothetical protein
MNSQDQGWTAFFLLNRNRTETIRIDVSEAQPRTFKQGSLAMKSINNFGVTEAIELLSMAGCEIGHDKWDKLTTGEQKQALRWAAASHFCLDLNEFPLPECLKQAKFENNHSSFCILNY